MTTKFALSDLERFIDGECLPDEARRIRTELERDAELASRFSRLEDMDRLVRSSARDVVAPATLRDAVQRLGENEIISGANEHDRQAGRPRFASRRALLTGAGGLLAAGLAAFAVVPRLDVFKHASNDPVATFFHDFETYLLGDKVTDVAETNMVNLAAWFSDRLAFALPPIGSAGAGAQLVGGRLCWLLERRLASLSYETEDGPLVMYVLQSSGLDVPAAREQSQIGRQLSWHRSGNSTSVMWETGDLLIVMVGTQEVHKLMSIARALVS